MVDLIPIIGMTLGLVLVMVGIVLTPGSALLQFADWASVMITVGGSVAATIITYPWRDLANMGKVLRQAFMQKVLVPVKIIDDFRRYADIARRDGILALENITGEIEDPFLVKGIQLAVDGTDPEVIQTMMRTELDQMIERHDRGVHVLRRVSEYAPAFGMIGTLIGLVVMLNNLGDPKAIGPAMAVAIITTFYGAMICYMAATPLAERLERKSNDEVLVREMMIKGVMSIQSGDNPRIVEQKLKIFLAPGLRGTGK